MTDQTLETKKIVYRHSISKTGKRRPSLHNMSHTKIHNIWVAMRARCNNSGHRYYGRYGGRGIKICDRWSKFENFYKDMGDRPEGLSLDRIDNDGDYEPSNCRWATCKEQNRNRSDNVMLLYNGVSKTTIEWAEDIGMNVSTLRKRVYAGWSDEDVICKPIGASRRKQGND